MSVMSKEKAAALAAHRGLSGSRVRLADCTYGLPVQDHEGKWLVDVQQDDGDRYCTYAAGAEVWDAWAEVLLFGRQLTEGDV